jgi:hypothetical protein
LHTNSFGTSSTSSGSNARARDPDVLQLDVIWTPEFAAAGWVLALDRSAANKLVGRP